MDKVILIVYLGDDGYGLTYRNDTFICQNYPLSIADLNHITESLKTRHGLKSVIIINIMPLTNK